MQKKRMPHKSYMIWPFNIFITEIGILLDSKLKPLLTELSVLKATQEKIMADEAQIERDEAAELVAIEDLKTTSIAVIAQIQTETQAIADQAQTIRDLKAQLASGSPITPAQLDALDDSITNGTAKIKDQTAALAAALTPAPPAPPVTPDPPPAPPEPPSDTTSA